MTNHVLFVNDNRSLGGVGQVSRQLDEGLRSLGWSVDHLNLAEPGRAWECLSRVDKLKGVILATQNFSTSYVACALAAISRRPWAMAVHGPVTRVLDVAGPGPFKRWLMRATYQRAPAIACSSQASLESLLSFCPVDTKRQKLRVIRNTAAAKFFDTPPVARPPSKRIGFVGRLSAEKQPGLLIETLKLLPPEWQLDVVGTGPLAPQLVEQGREEIAAGRLRFMGLQEVSASTYRQWDATLLCSSYEGYPLVLLESLASGVPVVSTPIAPAVEMLGTHAPAMIAKDASPRAMADALLALPGGGQLAHEIAAVNAEHDPARFAAAWAALLSESLQP